MKTQTISGTYIADIRRLAEGIDAQAIEQCLQLAMANEANPCYPADETGEAMNVLAKVGFVKTQMQQGRTVNEAVRELGKRMRALQYTKENEE